MPLLFWQSTLIQGSINVHRLNTFKHRLHEGKLYAINGFDVVRSNNHFKLCNLNVSIRFTDNTSLDDLTDTDCSIPMEMFNLCGHDQLVALANTNSQLPGEFTNL